MMKIPSVILFLLLISCGQNPKEKQQEITVDSSTEQQPDITKSKASSLTFEEAIAQTKTKPLPQLEATNFDSFIEPEDYDEVNVQLFQLESIYPNFHTEGYNYQAISKYQLSISLDFYTVVITIKKGDNEMESVLVNYDHSGKIIDYKTVSYDEIAEGMSRVVSRISKNKIVTHNVFWSEIKEVEESTYSIHSNGKIEKQSSLKIRDVFKDYTLINSVLMDLNLDWIQLKTHLITSKPSPINNNETILVLPLVKDEGEHYFELIPHLVIVNNQTAQILQHYKATQPEDILVSDALGLERMSIDEEVYQLSKTTKAFGVRVDYVGSSRANPFANQILSLFVPSNNTLKKVLDNFEIITDRGIWDTMCNGEFFTSKKELIISEDHTNGLFDINVIERITETTAFEDQNGDCDENTSNSIKKQLLTYKGDVYNLSNDVAQPLTFYVKDNVPDQAHIFTQPNGNVLYGLAQESNYRVTTDKFEDGWFRAIELDEIDAEIIDLPRGYGWIHHSALVASTRAKVKLLDQPINGSIIGEIDPEIQVNIIATKDNWVNIQYKELTGWVNADRLCGNPVTTCP